MFCCTRRISSFYTVTPTFLTDPAVYCTSSKEITELFLFVVTNSRAPTSMIRSESASRVNVDFVDSVCTFSVHVYKPTTHLHDAHCNTTLVLFPNSAADACYGAHLKRFSRVCFLSNYHVNCFSEPCI